MKDDNLPPDNETVEDGGGCYVAGSREQEAAHSSLSVCPFCGLLPEWVNESLQDGHFYIRCPHCHIVMKEDRRDKVIGMWNRRAELTRLRSELQQKDEKIKECIKTIIWMFNRIKERFSVDSVDQIYLLSNEQLLSVSMFGKMRLQRLRNLQPDKEITDYERGFNEGVDKTIIEVCRAITDNYKKCITQREIDVIKLGQKIKQHGKSN